MPARERLLQLSSHLHRGAAGADSPGRRRRRAAAAPPPAGVGGAVQCGGVRIAYCIYEPAQGAAAGLPVLVLRGLGMTKEDSAGLAAALVAKGRRVVAVDNRGSGDSDHPDGGYQFSDIAADATAVMRHLRLPRYHVFGVSMGGACALLAALAAPEAAASLVVGCSYFGGPNMAKVPKEYQRLVTQTPPAEEAPFRAWVLDLFRRNFTEQWMASREGAPRFAALLADYERAERRRRDLPVSNATGQTQAALAFLKDGIEGRLHSVTAPCLVVTGAEDGIVPPRNSELLQRRLRGSELLSLPGLGHMFWEMAPTASADVLDSFWRRHDASPA